MKDKYFIIILLISILLFSFLISFQFRSWRDSLDKFEMPDFDLESLELDFSKNQQGDESNLFRTEDGRLEIEFSSSWMKVDFLDELNNEMKKEGAELLLFAQKFNLTDSVFSYMIVQKMEVGEESLQDVIDLLKQQSLEKNVEMDIMKEEITENEALLYFKIVQSGQPVLCSKEKIFKSGNEVFLIDVATMEKDCRSTEAEAEEILKSIKFED